MSKFMYKEQKETAVNPTLMKVAIVNENVENNISVIGNPVINETNMSSSQRQISPFL